MKYSLIISVHGDIHADTVESALKEKGVKVLRLNTDKFISDRIELVLGFDVEESLSILNETVPLDKISSVLYRRPGVPYTGVSLPGQREFSEREADEFIKQLYFYLWHAVWVNNYGALDKARRKYFQLHIAKEIGMKIPKTLISNSPKQVRDFFEVCGKKMIYKTLKSPVIRDDKGIELWGVPTTLINEQLLKNLDLIRYTGGIFQEYIEKDYELRVTIIGNDIFAAKIYSQSDPSGMVDWRDAVAFNKVPVIAYDLPNSVAKQCFTIIKKFNLVFGAIDLIKTSKGEYVFLELNPNGQWLWVEELTKQPMVASMVKLLLAND